MEKRIASVAAFLLTLTEGGHNYNVKNDFHAKGDNSTDDTDAVMNAFVAMKDGGTLTFPKGLYRVGKLKLETCRNPVTLKFESGAELTVRVSSKTKKDEDDWHRGSGSSGYRFGGSWGWVHLENCPGVTIDGLTMRGGGHWWWDLYSYDDWPKKGHNPDPYMLTASSSDGLTFKNIHIDLAPALNIKISKSNKVRMNNIRLTTKPEASHNTDGILLADVEDACLDNLYIVNGDDCLKVLDHVKDVTFSNFYCQGGHGLTIGGGGSKLKIENVHWVNGDLVSMSDGARFKFTAKTEGYVKNVAWENITMMDVHHPVAISANYGGDGTRSKENFEVGDVYYTDIKARYDRHDPRCYKEGPPWNRPCGVYSGHFLRCDKKAPCNKVHVTNVDIDFSVTDKSPYLGWETSYAGGTWDGVAKSGGGLEGFSRDSGHHTGGTGNCPAVSPTPSPFPSPSPSPSPTPSPTPSPGGCSLVTQLSQTSCISGSNFGCENGKAWTSGGCRAQITCPTGELTTLNDKDTSGRQECNCGSSCGSSIKPDDRRRRSPSPSPSPPPDDGRRRSSDERRRRTRRRSAEEEFYTV